jgi:transposase
VHKEYEEGTTMVYSEEFKRSMVKRMTGARGRSVNALSEEVGVCQGTLSRWLRRYGSENGMGKKRKEFGAEEKLEMVLEAAQMSDAELGEYLRKKGLHSVELARWKEEALSGLKTEKRGRPKVDPEIARLRKREKELAGNLRKKEKALAEASALLVMKKKAELIWGGSEDDELD